MATFHWQDRLVRGVALLCTAGFLLTLSGCGGRNHPVKGKLVYDEAGQPPLTDLAGHEVTFTSEELHVSARGEIQPDGSFALGTDRPGNGVPVGRYKVTVTQNHPRPGRPDRSPPVVEDRYEDPDQTPLEATVESKANEFTFALRRRPAQRGKEAAAERE